MQANLATMLRTKLRYWKDEIWRRQNFYFYSNFSILIKATCTCTCTLLADVHVRTPANSYTTVLLYGCLDSPTGPVDSLSSTTTPPFAVGVALLPMGSWVVMWAGDCEEGVVFPAVGSDRGSPMSMVSTSTSMVSITLVLPKPLILER